MQLYGLLGYPLRYSLSPAIHQAAYRALGMEAAYLLWPTSPEELQVRLTELSQDKSVKGFNVTVPHKTSIMPLLDQVSPEATAIGAVNTVVKRQGQLFGENTDSYGCSAMLQDAGIQIAGQQVLLLGAGGAARAVLHALLGMGIERVWIMNRTQEKAEQLLRDLPHETRGRFHCLTTGLDSLSALSQEDSGSPTYLQDVIGYISLVINATSSQDPWSAFGLCAEQVWTRGAGWAVDLMYGNMLDGFLQQASKSGWQTVSGEGMLLHQAARAFELWSGLSAPLEAMRSALMQQLGGNA